MNIKKVGWPILALVLLIILLLCMYTHGFEDLDLPLPTQDIGEPTGTGTPTADPPLSGNWELCATYTSDESWVSAGAVEETTIDLPNCAENEELKFTFERWFIPEPNMTCSGPVEWEVYDSSFFMRWLYRQDTSTVNTFAQFGGTPDEVTGAEWDGRTPWRVFFKNNCGWMVCREWQLKVYHWVGSGTPPPASVTPDSPWGLPGFELMIFTFALFVSCIILWRRKREI